MKQWYEELFENYASRYDSEIFTQGTSGECDFIERELDHDTTLKILDVGCGTGTLTRELAAALRDKARSCVVGIDAAGAMIRAARRKAAGIPNIAFAPALAEQLPFTDGSFDLAVSTMFFHHVEAGLKRRALDELWRVLVPGGRVIVVDLTTPTTPFGAFCAWSGYLLFRQAAIRENMRGELERAFADSRFGGTRLTGRHAGYIATYELVKASA